MPGSAGLAHEMNQPLAIIGLAAENAADELRMEGEAAIPAALTRLGRIVRQAARGAPSFTIFGSSAAPAPWTRPAPPGLGRCWTGPSS